jgi:hypothetical protein
MQYIQFFRHPLPASRACMHVPPEATWEAVGGMWN